MSNQPKDERKIPILTEGYVKKGGQNPNLTSSKRPPAPKGSGIKQK